MTVIRVRIRQRRRSEGWWAFAAFVVLIGLVAQLSTVAGTVVTFLAGAIYTAVLISRSRR